MIIYTFGDSSAQKVENFRRLVDLDFSKRYVDFIEKTNGGLVDSNSVPSIVIPSTGEEVRITLFYGLTNDDRDIIKVNKKYFELLPEKSVIIAESDKDGYFVVGKGDEGNSLFYWDEQRRLSVSSEDGNAYLLSNSPDEFWDELGEIEIRNINDYDKGENNMENINYVPLGSIVLLEGAIQKLLVTSRGLIVDNAGQNVLFDYAGVLYPEGLIGDQIVYFNHKDIAKVVFEGYKDEEDEITVNNINKYVAEHPDLERGSVENWKA